MNVYIVIINILYIFITPTMDNKRVIYLWEKLERIEVQDHFENEEVKTVLIYNAGERLEFDTKTKELYRMFITEEDLEKVREINNNLEKPEDYQKATPSKKVLFDLYYGDMFNPISAVEAIEKYIELQA